MTDLEQRTVPGLHDFVVERVLPLHAQPPCRVVDLGAGSGALASRLASLGFDVTAADIEQDRFRAPVPFVVVDLDDSTTLQRLEPPFQLVTAVEVIEHLESPIGFLRSIRDLLAPDGLAIVTTPNVDSVPARLKFLVKGKIRLLDEYGDPTHVSPIFWDLLVRQYLPRSGLRMSAHYVFPSDGFIAGNKIYQPALRLLASVKGLRGRYGTLLGDNHVLVLERR